MPNNMQPHPFVSMLYVQRQKSAHCEWHAFVNDALHSNTTGRRKLIKGSWRYHQRPWFYVRWLTETRDVPFANYFSNPFAFYPSQLYLNQILNQASPYLHISLNTQTVNISLQKVTAGTEHQDPESYAFVIHKTTKSFLINMFNIIAWEGVPIIVQLGDLIHKNQGKSD